ncbi:MAG: PAS domain S-box protein [Phycisphaerae bacterium]|nr:PAS domain S-box protein [Phycisphaerae bacterium]
MMPKKLRQVLTLNFIAVAALPVLAVGLIALRSLSVSLEEEITEKNYIIAKSIAGDVERFLNEPLNLLEQIRNLKRKGIVSEKELNEYLAGLVTQYPIFNVIRILDQKGIVTHLAPFDENIPGLDMSNQPYYRVARKTGESHWSHTLILSQTRRLALTLTLPLEKEMIVGYLNLSELNRVIDKVKIGDSGYAAIIDSNGTIIAHPDQKFVSERTNVKHLFFAQQSMMGKERTFFYRFMGVEKIGSVAFVPQTHWMVIVTQPIEEAFLPVQRVRNIGWAGMLAAILLAGFIALINLKRVLKPLLRLEKESQRIADGDYTYEPESIPYLEIRNVAHSFKTMIDAIRDRDKELRNSEAKYRQLVESSRILIWSVDSLGRWTYLNENAARRIYGYEPGEMLGKPFTDFMTPEQAKKDWGIFEEIMAGKNQVNYETVHLRKDGTPIMMNFSAIVLRDEQGESLGTTGTAGDITERKRAEEALRESERRLREAQQLAHLGNWHWDIQTGNVEWSDEVYEIFRFDPNQVTPQIDSILTLLPWSEHHSRDQESIQKAFESLEFGSYEQESLRADGSTGFYTVTLQGIYDDDGRLAVIRGTVQDITERKQIEEERLSLERQVQHVQKLESLGVLAGGIAHDFNNLLMGILGNADLAIGILPPYSPARENIREIEKASKRAAELAKQMLAYSGKGRFIIKSIDLNEFVEEMAHLLKVSISKKTMLRYHFAKNLPFFDGDVTQIRQVIMNLITNASEAIGDNSGVITLSTGATHCDRAYLDNINKTMPADLHQLMPEGVYVYLEVRDTGCGMDTKTIEKLFDPFFTTKFMGRGLGLSAVLGIVRGHRGIINVYSEIGKGTTFKVLFPASPSPQNPTADRSEDNAVEEDWRGSGTVLLVDDEELIQHAGKQMLERIGFTVLTASDGEEALRIFQESDGDIDCVLLDLTMPRMSGEECLRELRKIKSDVRIVLSSGYNEQDVVRRFTEKGPAGFIQKPYQTENLRRKMKEIFSQKVEEIS